MAAEVFPDGRLRVYVYPNAFAWVPMLCIDYSSVDADPASGTRYHIHTDHLGCPERILDDAGQTVWKARIDPYGTAHVEIGADFHQPLRWPGHYYDIETGLHENRFRSYSPELGRYLQSDPIGTKGGLNLYAYTENPTKAVDLRGQNDGCPDGPNCPQRKKKEAEGGDDKEGDKPLHERKGWVDEYGEQKKVTGDGSCDRDHQPSKAAIKKAVADDIQKRVKAGEIDPPSDAQMKKINDRIEKEALSVVVDHDVHKDGPTHGHKNNSDLIASDSKDLGAAARRDADAMVENTAKHDPESLPANQAAADKIKQQTHESIMQKNRQIVDEVLKEK